MLNFLTPFTREELEIGHDQHLQNPNNITEFKTVPLSNITVSIIYQALYYSD